MNLHTSYNSVEPNHQGLQPSLGAEVGNGVTGFADLAAQRLVAFRGRLSGTLESKAPALYQGLKDLADRGRQTRERLRAVDYGARSVQAVGAAVILGTLYVAIWGTGPQPVAETPEVVASRIAPIGTLMLQGGSPIMAENQPTAAPSAPSL